MKLKCTSSMLENLNKFVKYLKSFFEMTSCEYVYILQWDTLTKYITKGTFLT